MKFLVLTLISNGPDPVTGRTPSPHERFHRVVDNAVLAEELGFDGFAVELAARYGDPLFSANVTNPIEPYAELVRLYRERWAAHGHDPAEALVGAGTAGFSVARTSQEAYDAFRPAFAQRQAMAERFGLPVVFPTFEDFVERSSALVGSPQQVIDKVLRYHEALGHEAIHLHSDGDGQTPAAHRAALELFQTDVAPVLRAAIPSRPLAGPIPFLGPPSTPVAEPVGAR